MSPSVFACYSVKHEVQINISEIENVREVLSKMFQKHKNQGKVAAEYIVKAYNNETDQGQEVTRMQIYIQNQELYYQYDDIEYYQSQIGTIWLNHAEHLANYSPRNITNNPVGVPQSTLLEQQLEMMLSGCDTVYLKGTENGKTIVSMEISYGSFNKVEMYINENYSLDKTAYYYFNEAYGLKSETQVTPLSQPKIKQIQSKVAIWKPAIAENRITNLFKNYEFLNNE